MGREWRILVVDDNELDVEKLQRVLKKLELSHQLTRAADGLEALELLGCDGLDATSERPDFVLLDLNMPRMNGFEFLAAIRQDPNLSRLPVFVVTTSDQRRDIEQVERLGAEGYLVKPLSADRITSAMAALEPPSASQEPAAPAALEADIRRETPAPIERAAKEARILLIDDDEIVGVCLERALRGSEWDVSSCQDPELALDHVSSIRPSVLIVDIRMPRMNGDEVLDRIAAQGELEGVRVLVSSEVEPSAAIWQPFADRGAEFVLKGDLGHWAKALADETE